jgi:hypothetical protein
MRRPLSGRKHFANIMEDAENDTVVQCTKHHVISEPTHLSVSKNGSVVSPGLHCIIEDSV